MTLKQFGIGALNFATNLVGFGSVLAQRTADTHDDALFARMSDFIKVIEQVEVFGAVMKAGGPDKAQAAGREFAQIFLRLFKAAGFELIGEKEAKFQAACVSVAGSIADIRDCFKK